MAKIKSLGDPHHPVEDDALEMVFDDLPGIGGRFLEGFSQYIETKKRTAVLSLLKSEFPSLAEDERFINTVVERLGNSLLDEERFVFLVRNPKYNA